VYPFSEFIPKLTPMVEIGFFLSTIDACPPPHARIGYFFLYPPILRHIRPIAFG
jgi:hypothetical protein